MPARQQANPRDRSKRKAMAARTPTIRREQTNGERLNPSRMEEGDMDDGGGAELSRRHNVAKMQKT